MEGRRGEENWRRDRTGAPEGGLGKKRDSHTQRAPLMVRGSVGTERDLQGIGGSEENVAAGLWRAGQSGTYVYGLCRSTVHPSLSCVSPGGEDGWVLESEVWRVDLGRGWLLAVGRQPGTARGKGSTAGKVGGGRPGHQGSGAPLLSGEQRAGPPLQCPSPPTGLASLGSGHT